MFGVRDGFGEQDGDVLVAKLVDRLATMAFADDQAEVTQHAQLGIDPSSYVVSGVGFLGAGVIISDGVSVAGSTPPPRSGAPPPSARWPPAGSSGKPASRPWR